MVTSSNNKVTRAKNIGKLENFYPSPFFDVASNYLPKTVKETFDWCLYYQLTNPIISAVTSKMASYPVTDLVYEEDNQGVVKLLKSIFEDQFDLRSFLVEVNLDRYTFGNSFVSVSFPIRKMAKCPSCGKEKPIAESSYIWRDYKFTITCKDCDYSGIFTVRDDPVRNLKKIRLIRWNPKNIVIKYNEITGERAYYYSMPRYMKNSITVGTPSIIENVPQAFIEAVKKGKTIKLDSSKIFHSKRASASRDPADSAWGAPLILPVLKDVFFLQVLRKSQEAVAMEHIVPMRVLFPQVTTDGSNPYQHINLKDWQNEVIDQIGKWRRDINHIPVMPMPIGFQQIGGQGRALLLHQEIRIYSEQIIAGLGVPTGFFYGEAMYSGASVNLRALENEFLGNRQDMLKMVNFIKDQVTVFLNIPEIGLKFKPFKMADDLQRASFDLSLVNTKMMSKKSFMQAQSHSYSSESEIITKEADRDNGLMREQAKANAEAQGESQVIMTRYQIKAQELMQEAQQAGLGQQQAQQQQAQQPQPGAVDPAAQQAQVDAMQQEAMPEQQMLDPTQQGMEQPPVEATGGESPMNMDVAQAGGTYVNLVDQADSLAQDIMGLGKVDMYKALSSLKRENPGLYMLVNQRINALPKSRIRKMTGLR